MSLLSKEELRRLEKAAKDKNKDKLRDWVVQFEEQLSNDMRIEYEKAYKDEVENTFDNIILATAYTLLFSEETKLDSDTLPRIYGRFICFNRYVSYRRI